MCGGGQQTSNARSASDCFVDFLAKHWITCYSQFNTQIPSPNPIKPNTPTGPSGAAPTPTLHPLQTCHPTQAPSSARGGISPLTASAGQDLGLLRSRLKSKSSEEINHTEKCVFVQGFAWNGCEFDATILGSKDTVIKYTQMCTQAVLVKKIVIFENPQSQLCCVHVCL